MSIVDLIPAPDAPSFERTATELEQWILRRVDLAGGWTPEMQAAFSVRTIGAYQFSLEQSRVLHDLGARLSDLYEQCGAAARRRFMSTEAKAQARSPDEHRVIRASLENEEGWATTLRADLLYDQSGRPQIVEVNTDAVAGIESVLLHLHFYRSRSSEPKLVEANIQRVETAVVAWARHHLGRAKDDEGLIAIVYIDRGVSQFLARYLADTLNRLGLRARACRPEHLFRAGRRLNLEDHDGSRLPVGLVWRHWLFFEMFDSTGGERRLKSEFLPFVEALEASEIVAVNPVHDHLLFSKSWLADLTTAAPDLALTAEQRALVETYVVPTERVTDRAQQKLRSGFVMKPAGEFGGQGVRHGGDGPTTTPPDVASLYDGEWVQQPVIHGETAERYLRWSARNAPTWITTRQALFVTHGVLVLRSPEPHLACVLTRLGPDPVVNWSRGSEYLAGLLPSPSSA